MTESRFRVPHTLVLLFGMIVAAYVLTYVLPQGTFERVEHDGHEIVVADSYQRVSEPVRLPLWAPLTAVPLGFDDAKGIIFFVFIIGGAFGVFRATGAADALIGFLLEVFGGLPGVLVAGGLVVFALGSSTIGMAEEYLPFVPVLLALCIGLRFDAVTAVGILCVGYGIGYGTAVINPFTVMIAQDIAGVAPGSGLGFRVVLLVVMLAIGFQHVWSYASRVRKDPSKSYVADIEPDASITERKHVDLDSTHVLALVATLGSLALLLYGLKWQGWYLVEMGALFLGLTLVLGAIARLGFDGTARAFCEGAGELTTTALLIGFARGIGIVLDDGQIVDTIIHGIAQPLKSLGPHAAAVGMLFVQSLCNLFIPSGSGQAYVTMPIMAPLGDIVGVTRQTAVLAYQFGDGFTNILVPTNPVLIGILTMARIPYERWLRFVLPFMVKIWIAAAVAMIVAVIINYS
jgi:uncharacterized ion transporter superfamily protein YfcC